MEQKNHEPRSHALKTAVRTLAVAGTLILATGPTPPAQHEKPMAPKTGALTPSPPLSAIIQMIILKGEIQNTYDAIVDTGAYQTTIPQRAADETGVKYTGETVTICSAFSECLPLKVASVGVTLPSLGEQTYPIKLLVNPKGNTIYIGMDLLNSLHIKIDAGNGNIIRAETTQVRVTSTK